MTMKRRFCRSCNVVLDIEHFKLRNDNLTYRNICNKCLNIQKREYYLKNNKKIKESKKEYSKLNSKQIVSKVNKWRLNNPEKYKESRNREVERARIRRSEDTEYRGKINTNKYKWRKNNPDKVREMKRKNREKNKNNLYLKLSNNLRSRFRQALKGNFKTGSAVRDLGCSINNFKEYLEERFYPNPRTGEEMNWNNYGKYGWHIDHIIPLCAFNLENHKEVEKACHYTNLRPMWAEENLKKGSKIISTKE